MEKNQARPLFAALSVIVSVIFFLAILNSPMPAFPKFLFAGIVLVLCGLAVAYSFGIESFAGLMLIRSSRGLSFLDHLAKRNPGLWQAAADVGMVVGYGSLAYFLIKRKKLDLKRDVPIFAIGTFLLVIFSSLLPVAMAVLLSLVTGGQEFATSGAKVTEQFAQFEFARALSFAFLSVGGIALTATVSVLAYAAVVGAAVLGAITGNVDALVNTSPGGMPIIPGVNLPLIPGILALAIVLAVHESAHGILARTFGLPLKSAGLVIFGFLPFGAFVDVDEKQLFKESKDKQNAVFVAGTSANFATSFVFFILFLAINLIFGGGQVVDPLVRDVARVLALTFSLNIIVASINLIPIPLFDGYYLMSNAVGNKKISHYISGAVAIGFILTLLPWIFR